MLTLQSCEQFDNFAKDSIFFIVRNSWIYGKHYNVLTNSIILLGLQ